MHQSSNPNQRSSMPNPFNDQTIGKSKKKRSMTNFTDSVPVRKGTKGKSKASNNCHSIRQ